MKKERIKPIPEKICDKIIQCAMNREKDVLTKFSLPQAGHPLGWQLGRFC